MLIFLILMHHVSADNGFPSVKLPHGGIFNWLNALSIWRKPFNNKNIFGFTTNSSEPDLRMMIDDIIDFLNLTDKNFSGEIDDIINMRNDTNSTYIYDDSEVYSESNSGIDDKDETQTDKCFGLYGNSLQLCRTLGLAIHSEDIGIKQEHMNIFIANIVGYIPTVFFLLILTIGSIIYYIVQMSLSYKFFKPVETTKPAIYSIIIFYSGDFLVFLSAIFYLVAFTGINHMFQSFNEFDTIIPRITHSLATSLISLVDYGIPDSLGPTIELFLGICNSTSEYLSNLTDSFITPTYTIQTTITSNNESDMGVFGIFSLKIQPVSNQLYTSMKKYHELDDIPRYFNDQDFAPYQNIIHYLLTAEIHFAKVVIDINTLLNYFRDILIPLKKYVVDIRNQNISDHNITVNEFLSNVQNTSIEDFYALQHLDKKAAAANPEWTAICIFYYIVGVFFLLTPIGLGFVFLLHNKLSICIANTIAICPLISTILMFVCSFLFTGIGFADSIISEKLEPSLDYFLDRVIEKTIPERVIYIAPIEISSHSNGNFNGTIHLSDIVFPHPLDMIQQFIESDDDTGIADAFNLPDIIKMDNYGEELGRFLVLLGQNFTLGQSINKGLDTVQQLFKYVENFPQEVDGYFNWGVPISLTTKKLRDDIQLKCPEAMNELDVYLNEIDSYVSLMNSQYQIALHEIYYSLPNALGKIESELSSYISSVMNYLGMSIEHALKSVYPVLNTIEIAPILGPYAIIRNVFLYDLAFTSAYISCSGHLMMVGFIVVVTMMWIRRKGMLPIKVTAQSSEDMQDYNDEDQSEKDKSHSHSDSKSKSKMKTKSKTRTKSKTTSEPISKIISSDSSSSIP
ncbi:hypothetical protein TRFO_18543 [Tritrichomonas foetus]|uniref:Uncharacterized protein n=1 Tax=Tritrichomonas foetus TaxID=1144522 RepID=A0A1J4KPZ4_9EUKA|nr:hypothetical protein TRFO_18543 [Tritrichomonas foetus]|eukprot:OHT11860.1 hypothetical protein TRFO_18543 [Tritrichomonas foetus]